MVQFQVWILLLFSIVSNVPVEGQKGDKPSYMVIIPSVMRPGRSFIASVQLFTNKKKKTNIMAEILNRKNEVLVSDKVTIKGSQGEIALDVPIENIETEHIYRIRGNGAVNFEKRATVKVSFKTVTILIQSDKAIYKPGQTVQFRCLAIYSDLKPYEGPFDVEIFDPRDNKMRQWTNVKGDPFVFSANFPLSEQPILGDWKIKVTVASGEEVSKEFAVEEFVLPKIEAKVAAPKFFHVSQKVLVATVSAQYTYGKPVKGTVKVTVSVDRGFPSSRHQSLNITGTLNKKGKFEVKLNFERLYKLYRCTFTFCESDSTVDRVNRLRGEDIKISAVITDDVSNEVVTADNTVKFEYNLHRIKFLENTPDTFRDGLRWIGFVQITFPDGSPPTNIEGDIMQVSFDFEERRRLDGRRFTSIVNSKLIKQNYTVTSDGIIKIKVDVPKSMTECDVRASFKSNPSTISAFKNLETFVSRANEGLQISIDGLEGAIEPGDNAKFKVTTTEPIEMYYYQLLSKGRIAKTGIENASGMKNMFSIKFDKMLAQETAPSARIIVWYITNGSEVIVDSIEFNVKGAFVNDVSLEFSEDKVKPGEKVKVTVHAHKDSVVGLLAVDQSVLLLRGGNDITQKDVLDDLLQYDSSSQHGGVIGRPIPGKKRRRRRRSICYLCYFPRSSGGKDATEMFENAGVIVMTDAYIHEKEEIQVPIRRCGKKRACRARVIPDRLRKKKVDAQPVKEQLEEPDDIRDVFPETWLWINSIIGKNGKVTMDYTVPDTITSWVASAFAVHGDVGLGIADDTAKLIVFKAFFAQIDLPFSAIRGELLQLQVLVFNFLNSEQKVTITLEKSEDDAFFARGPDDKSANKVQALSQTISVPAGDGVNVIFWIKPIKIGQTPVQVKAQSLQAADALKRLLLVEPEGEPQVYTKAWFLELEKGSNFKETVDILFPGDVVEDSQRVMFTAIGDIMGPTIQNLDKLLRMPSGCGEQNMLNFAPNIFVMDYLTAVGQVTPEIKDKVEGFMVRGYTNELSFQRSDGSFSAFGNRDKQGSMWLTAFVIWSFSRAKPYTVIDNKVIESGIRWILRHKGSDGSFAEPPGGKTLHTDMQGGASRGTALTAYVLITLQRLVDDVDNLVLKNDLNTAIEKTIGHLVGLLESVKGDVYAMAVITYALTIKNHQKKNLALQYFNDLATKEGGLTFWKRDDKEIEVKWDWRPPYRRKPSNSIEMTAYGVLIHLERNEIGEAATIIRWLAAQRNSFGGYSSTQDTVVGIDALSQFAVKAKGNPKQNVVVTVSDSMHTHEFDPITKDNMDILQTFEVSEPKSVMDVKATGQGICLIQLSVFYHKATPKDIRGFKLKVTSDYDATGKLVTNICYVYKVKGIPSGMVVIEMDQLTGHVPIESRAILEMNAGKGIKKIEYLNNRKLVIYLDEATSAEVCIKVISIREQLVENLQHALCRIFSYYRLEVSDSKLYIPGGADTETSVSTTSSFTTIPPATVFTTIPPATVTDTTTSKATILSTTEVDALTTTGETTTVTDKTKKPKKPKRTKDPKTTTEGEPPQTTTLIDDEEITSTDTTSTQTTLKGKGRRKKKKGSRKNTTLPTTELDASTTTDETTIITDTTNKPRTTGKPQTTTEGEPPQTTTLIDDEETTSTDTTSTKTTLKGKGRRKKKKGSRKNTGKPKNEKKSTRNPKSESKKPKKQKGQRNKTGKPKKGTKGNGKKKTGNQNKGQKTKKPKEKKKKSTKQAPESIPSTTSESRRATPGPNGIIP